MNWGPGAQGGFQNALQVGLQLGGIARQREQQNALLEQRNRALDQRDEQFAAAQMAAKEKADAEARLAAVSAKAANGDEAALDELATLNFDRYTKIDAQQKAQTREEQAVLGQAALDVLRLPSEQRPNAVVNFAQNMPQYANEIGKIAYLPPAELEAALRSQIANAKMIEKLHSMEQPRYQAVPERGDLVNTRDPNAVRRFQQGAQQYSEGQTATNPATGERVIYRNGRWEPM